MLGDSMHELKTLLTDVNTICQLSFYKKYYINLDLNYKIEKCNNIIQNIYKKYNIDNINGLILIIEESIKNVEIIEDEELVRLLVFAILDSKKRKVLDYNDEILKSIYKHIIKRGLYNPNWSVGTSGEPLFAMLPNLVDLYTVNLLVFNNNLFDLNILVNGTDSFIHFVYSYMNSNNEYEKLYYLEIIKSIIDKVDFDSKRRYKSFQKNIFYEVESINECLEKLSNNQAIGPILSLVAIKKA